MILNPKKLIGFLGRKIGGQRYQNLRDHLFNSFEHYRRELDTILIRCNISPTDSLYHRLSKSLYSDDNLNENDSSSRKAICILDGSFTHGGLTDRIRGILSVYQEAKRRDIPFCIYWIHPFILSKFLLPADPNTLDWRISEDALCRNLKHSKLIIADDLTETESQHRLEASFHSNHQQLHFYTNADIGRGSYQYLFNELFKPSPLLKVALRKHQSRLTSAYQAFAFRFLTLLDDFTDFKVPELSPEQQETLMQKVEEELRRLIKEVPDDQSIFITGDSIRFLNRVRNIDPRIYVVDGDIRHIDLDTNQTEETELKTFVDQFLLMGAYKVTLLRTGRMYRSGFSRFAAEVGGAEFIDHEF